jgi:hypothetical protein
MLELKPGRVGRISPREAAPDEPEPLSLAPYCFLKLLAFNHRASLHSLIGFP